MYWYRSGPEIPGCLSVCVRVSVCLCVCVCLCVRASMPQIPGRLKKTFPKWFPIVLIVRVCISAH